MISKSRFKNTHVHIAVSVGKTPIQNIYLSVSDVRTNLVPRAHDPLGLHPWRRPKGSWALGTRLTSAHARNARAVYLLMQSFLMLM